MAFSHQSCKLLDGNRSFTVAIDGPAASGKGTISGRIATKFGFAHLDTGLLYRRVALEVDKMFGETFEEENVLQVIELAMNKDLELKELRSARVGNLTPRVAAMPKVREALKTFQRDFARRDGGAVLDGRDIGTVICPDAEVKLFVTASDEVRAQRRWSELADPDLSLEDVLADLRARDRRDTERAAAPLRPAQDAVVLDTSGMDIDTAVDAAAARIAAALG